MGKALKAILLGASAVGVAILGVVAYDSFKTQHKKIKDSYGLDNDDYYFDEEDVDDMDLDDDDSYNSSFDMSESEFEDFEEELAEDMLADC